MARFDVKSNMHSHPSARTAGLEAIGLWVLAGTYSIETGCPGAIDDDGLRAIGGTRHIARRLVKAGLWVESEAGWEFANSEDLWRIVYYGARSPIPDEIRSMVYERDGYKCITCGSAEDLSLDHIHPWSRGGADTEDNLQTMCRPCNSRKGARVDQG